MMNGGVQAEVEIIELSLSGNQEYSAMVANKLQWLTVDGAGTGREASSKIELQQQRIRVFSVAYSVKGDFL
jgi:hypothetical protein